MSSELKANKISPATGTTTTLGDASDVFQLPASAEIDIASGATLDINGTADFTGATISGLDTGTANKPYFFAKTTADSTWGSGSYTQVVLNSVVAESNAGSFSTTNYEFTVPTGEGGTYLIGMHLFVPSGVPGAYMKIQLNGSDTTASPSEWYMNSSNSANRRVQPNFLMTLAAGDVIDWWLYGTSGTTNGGNWVWGWRVW